MADDGGFSGMGLSALPWGGTDFWDPLVDWRAGKKTHDEAAAEMAKRYREFVDLFEAAKHGDKEKSSDAK